MKKLMIAATAALLGVAAQAAAVNWEIKGDWVSSDGENPLEVAMYAFDAQTKSLASVTEALAAGDLTVLDSALVSGVVNDEGVLI